MIKQLYKFDVLVAVDGSEHYARLLGWFRQVNPLDPDFKANRGFKDLLRVTP